MKKLFESFAIKDLTLNNKIVMAPLTRSRAKLDGTPTDMIATYYQQRATAGLIIAEATQISQQGQGYIATPGIYTKEHVQGWKRVVQQVHQVGGCISLQLWHVGRISHEEFQPNHDAPVAPSAIQAKAKVYNQQGF
jgi:N-ethylmaleimide reductase